MTGSDTKAYFEVETGEQITCLFNPAELALTRSNEWRSGSRPGRDVPTLEYAGATGGTLSFEVFFDTTATGASATQYTGQLVALMDVDPTVPGSDESTGNVRPPTVVFHWGDLHSFRAVVAALDVRLIYFSATGVPLRARVQVTLRQYEQSDAFGPQNPTSTTLRPHAVHRVSRGETLDRIAARYYADPTAWRLIAEANDIDNPLSLRPGMLIAIPGRT